MQFHSSKVLRNRSATIGRRLPLVSALALVILLGLFARRSFALPVLNSIEQLRKLDPAEANRGYPVRLRAVVTFYHYAPKVDTVLQSDLSSNMFIQDATGGNWVKISSGEQPLHVGDWIELEGRTAQSDFAPDIVDAHWRVLGKRPLPVPTHQEFGPLASTEDDSLWVEIDGIVRSAQPTNGDLKMDIAMDGGHVTAYMPDVQRPFPAGLIDARVRVRGVCGALFNSKNQMRGVSFFVPGWQQVQILQPGLTDPFTVPMRPIASVLRFTVGGATGHRVRVSGVVTLQRRLQFVFLKGEKGSIRVKLTDAIQLQPGQRVEAVGFPVIGENNPVLEQGRVRVLSSGQAIAAQPANAAELMRNGNEGDLVQIDARLLSKSLTAREQVLTAESGRVMVQAELDDPAALAVFNDIEPGSTLRLTGISSVSNSETLRILLRSTADVAVVSRPSWWTFRRSLWVVASMTALIIAIFAWLWILRRRLRAQTRIIRTQLQSEAALERRYSRLFERNLAGVYRMNTQGIMLDANDACAQILGYKNRELLMGSGARHSELQAAILGRLSAESPIAQSEVSLRRRDGREIWVLTNANLLEDGSSVEGTIIEITELKETVRILEAAQIELRATKDAAEAANRAKSEFLANMSHEIRTPLNGVLLAAELTSSEALTPAQKEYLQTIRASGESLLVLLNDLLDLSKIEAGKMELHRANFSVEKCLLECTSLLEARARQKSVDLHLVLDENIPAIVCGDALRLRQVMLNLIGNAVKFTGSGSVTVRAEYLGMKDDSLRCQFSVQDTGIGIPAEKHAAVFREFEQADASTTRRFGGTGLGLAICRRLVELMGGTIWVESELHRGSTFSFTAVFNQATDGATLGPTQANVVEAIETTSLRILLAEDNAINKRLAVRLLEKHGHSVVAVETGLAAVQKAAGGTFDVILMDVHMPEMDGIEATRQIRCNEQNTGVRIPIIAMTASAMREDRDACAAAGMDGYVAKPISTGELLAELRNVTLCTPAVG